MVLVDRIRQAIAEFQFGYQFEEGQVEVAAQADLDKRVCAFQLDIVLILAREVDHRVDACHHVRAVVVPTLC